MNTDQTILVIGAGSIGERHIGILQQLGYHRIVVYRQRLMPLRTIDAASMTTVTSWPDVLAHRPKAAIICTPTHQHAAQALQCLQAGMHVLIEKPISHEPQVHHTLTQALQAQAQPLHVQVAYMLRYHPFVQQARQTIASGILGRLLHGQSYWGEYLPAWHPWEDYRTSYAARTDMGGGAALTLSHDIDLWFYLLQAKPASWHTILQHYSPLEVDANSAADIVLRFQPGVQCNVHVNYFEQPARRYYRLVFEQGSLEYDYLQNTLYTNTPQGQTVQRFDGFERNDMFVAQARHFLAQCQTPNLQQSLHNLQEAFLITEICQ